MYNQLYFNYNSSWLGLHNETLAQKQTNKIQFNIHRNSDKQILFIRMVDMIEKSPSGPHLTSVKACSEAVLAETAASHISEMSSAH